MQNGFLEARKYFFNIKENSMLLFIIILLIIMPPLAIDEYSASLPAMVEGLNTTAALIQLTFSAYLLAQGISQVISGPLSDRFGRRRPLIISIIVYLVGSCMCLFAPGVSVLLVGRLLQGLGMGCAAISAPAIIGDSYTGEKFAKASSLVFIVYSLVPIVAPVIGGYLQQWLGWRANFALLLMFPLAALIVIMLRLPETHKPTSENDISIKNLKRNYVRLLSNNNFVVAVITMAILWSIIIVFSVTAPFIIQKNMGYSARVYGEVALFVGLAFLLGTLFSRRFSVEKNNILIKLGLVFQFVFSTLLLVLVLLGFTSLWAMITPIVFLIFSNAMVFPKLYAISLSIFPKLMGMASSLVGAIMLFGSVISIAVIARMNLHTLTFVACTYTALSTLSLGTICFYKFETTSFAVQEDQSPL
jgi:DHA1 family 2-module integral membrane pump EmrD-like MFS transporter